MRFILVALFLAGCATTPKQNGKTFTISGCKQVAKNNFGNLYDCASPPQSICTSFDAPDGVTEVMCMFQEK